MERGFFDGTPGLVGLREAEVWEAVGAVVLGVGQHQFIQEGKKGKQLHIPSQQITINERKQKGLRTILHAQGHVLMNDNLGIVMLLNTWSVVRKKMSSPLCNAVATCIASSNDILSP